MFADSTKNLLELVSCLSNINSDKALEINAKGMIGSKGQYIEF